jgi:hypothetical protein
MRDEVWHPVSESQQLMSYMMCEWEFIKYVIFQLVIERPSVFHLQGFWDFWNFMRFVHFEVGIEELALVASYKGIIQVLVVALYGKFLS